nr:hypothetical protein [Candidatus Woesearchaeota archaeon]
MGYIYSKKGQVGMIEMIMVLVVVILILVIGIFYYYRFYLAEIGKTESGLNDIDRDILLASILTMPEIECSFNGIEQNCIDMNKVKTDKINENKGLYFSRLGFRNITIMDVYPGTEEAVVLYENPRPNFRSKDIISVIVPLYYSDNEYRVGKLVIEDYK